MKIVHGLVLAFVVLYVNAGPSKNVSLKSSSFGNEGKQGPEATPQLLPCTICNNGKTLVKSFPFQSKCYCDEDAIKIFECVREINPSWPLAQTDGTKKLSDCPDPSTDMPGYAACVLDAQPKKAPDADDTAIECISKTGAKEGTKAPPRQIPGPEGLASTTTTTESASAVLLNVSTTTTESESATSIDDISLPTGDTNPEGLTDNDKKSFKFLL